MDLAEIQKRIDAVTWYHEFDFGNGLKARSNTSDVEGHRAIWAGIRAGLDRIDFTGKSVLDIGCWDGYWSFDAEKRGAAEVLATDDISQNWASGQGLPLARELLNSSIAINQNLSVYDVASLGRKFDIILCLGVYYHLIDPFYAFAQIRHCCHDDTLVVFEGDATLGIRTDTFYFDFANRSSTAFLPTPRGLKEMLEAAYFTVQSRDWILRAEPKSLRVRLAILHQASRTFKQWIPPAPRRNGRMITLCRPFTGECLLHRYKPPFGLHRYDPRFA